MPRRIVRQRTNVATSTPNYPPKIFLVGPNQSMKNDFVKSFFSPTFQESLNFTFGGQVGLEVFPVHYQGKSYNIWDGTSNLDEHLLSWGQGSKLIITFDDDESWVDRMKNLFPQTQVKPFNPDSKLANLQVN